MICIQSEKLADLNKAVMMALLCSMGWFYCLPLLVVQAGFNTDGIVAVHSSRSFLPDCLIRRSAPREVQAPNCGEGMCRCAGWEADCSGHWGNMTYIPTLPREMSSVDLSCNNFSSKFLTRHTFDNLTQFTHLILSYNNISWLPDGVFKKMRRLFSLHLDGNEALELSSFRGSILLDRIQILTATNCRISQPPVDFFKNSTSRLEEVRLDSNPHGGTYNLAGFCALQFLRHLYLIECDFKDITSSCSLLRLFKLNLSGNALRTFPKTCIGKKSIYPSLKWLYIASNRIEAVSMAEVCLPSLVELDMSSNFIELYPTNTFSSVNFPLLHRLDLQHNSRHPRSIKDLRIEDNAFTNPNLSSLLLTNNALDFEKDVSHYAFANCNNIEYLTIDSNDFKHVDDQSFLLFFGHLRSLKLLSMGNVGLQSISANTFGNFPQLQTLLLGNNMIDNIPDGTFDSLQQLTALYLDDNKIKTINENTFGETVGGNLSQLRLSFNPFMCTCDLLWFQHWFLTRQFDRSTTTDYKCHNIPGRTIANFSLGEQACLLSQEASLFIIQSCSIVIFALTLFSLVFRYRWHLRLFLYEAFRGRDVLRRRQRLMEKDFDFDVFVSYTSENLPWVQGRLMARLEGELGLRLCVHERDFIPGNHIVDNIVQCVEGSKKILMLFSRHFVRSQWCQFELSLCLSHVMDYGDALIVVCVDDVTSRHMTSSMMAVMKTTTCIQWREEEEDAETAFWGRLDLALQEVLPENDQYV